MLFLLRYALVRLLPRLPHEERTERHGAASGPVAFVVLCASLHRRRRRRVVLPVPRFVLIRCYSCVVHHQQTRELQAHGRRAMIVRPSGKNIDCPRPVNFIADSEADGARCYDPAVEAQLLRTISELSIRRPCLVLLVGGQYASCVNSDESCDPIPARVNTDFLWRRSPFYWCGREDLNLHSLARRRNLKHAHLPSPPRPQKFQSFKPTRSHIWHRSPRSYLPLRFFSRADVLTLKSPSSAFKMLRRFSARARRIFNRCGSHLHRGATPKGCPM
jgi:hypothetical protein